MLWASPRRNAPNACLWRGFAPSPGHFDRKWTAKRLFGGLGRAFIGGAVGLWLAGARFAGLALRLGGLFLGRLDQTAVAVIGLKEADRADTQIDIRLLRGARIGLRFWLAAGTSTEM